MYRAGESVSSHSTGSCLRYAVTRNETFSFPLCLHGTIRRSMLETMDLSKHHLAYGSIQLKITEERIRVLHTLLNNMLVRKSLSRGSVALLSGKLVTRSMVK